MTMDCTQALFCVRCFATDTDGSWQHTVVPEANYCTNCGGGGTSVKIPRWAVDEIRKNASWVGKRYYPHEEDKERRVELEALRSTIKIFKGRKAKRVDDAENGEPQFLVTQDLGGGRNVSVVINAESQKVALNKTKTLLPYVENPDADI